MKIVESSVSPFFSPFRRFHMQFTDSYTASEVTFRSECVRRCSNGLSMNVNCELKLQVTLSFWNDLLRFLLTSPAAVAAFKESSERK